MPLVRGDSLLLAKKIGNPTLLTKCASRRVSTDRSQLPSSNYGAGAPVLHSTAGLLHPGIEFGLQGVLRIEFVLLLRCLHLLFHHLVVDLLLLHGHRFRVSGLLLHLGAIVDS